jgi:hypothetical protein
VSCLHHLFHADYLTLGVEKYVEDEEARGCMYILHTRTHHTHTHTCLTTVFVTRRTERERARTRAVTNVSGRNITMRFARRSGSNGSIANPTFCNSICHYVIVGSGSFRPGKPTVFRDFLYCYGSKSQIDCKQFLNLEVNSAICIRIPLQSKCPRCPLHNKKKGKQSRTGLIT